LAIGKNIIMPMAMAELGAVFYPGPKRIVQESTKFIYL